MGQPRLTSGATRPTSSACVRSSTACDRAVFNTNSNLIHGSLQGGSGYLEALDGITIEGFTYHCFTPGDCRANDPSRRSVEGDWAARAQAHGTKVFVLDYAFDPASQQYAWRETRSRGWTPAVNRGPRLGYWEAD